MRWSPVLQTKALYHIICTLYSVQENLGKICQQKKIEMPLSLWFCKDFFFFLRRKKPHQDMNYCHIFKPFTETWSMVPWAVWVCKTLYHITKSLQDVLLSLAPNSRDVRLVVPCFQHFLTTPCCAVLAESKFPIKCICLNNTCFKAQSLSVIPLQWYILLYEPSPQAFELWFYHNVS